MSLTSMPNNKAFDTHYDKTFHDRRRDPPCKNCRTREWTVSYPKSKRTLICKRCGTVKIEGKYVEEIAPLVRDDKTGTKGTKDLQLIPQPLASKHGYQAPFWTGQPNFLFWREVLENRTILEVLFNEKGVEGIRLDDGQIVRLVMVCGEATVSIQD